MIKTCKCDECEYANKIQTCPYDHGYMSALNQISTQCDEIVRQTQRLIDLDRIVTQP
jgi:hypothetical protein